MVFWSIFSGRTFSRVSRVFWCFNKVTIALSLVLQTPGVLFWLVFSIVFSWVFPDFSRLF